jgi:hypothetical protein
VAAADPAANARTATVSPRLGATVGMVSAQGIGRSKGETRLDRIRPSIRLPIRLPSAVRTIEAAATSLEETAAAVMTATSNTAGAEAAGPTIGAGCLVANATADLTVRGIFWIQIQNPSEN